MSNARNRAVKRLHEAANFAREWVYIMSNIAMPELIKVGYSMKDPALRADELNHTGVPHPYTLECDILVTGPRKIEQLTHIELRSVAEGKEWFRISAKSAYKTIIKVIKAHPDHTILMVSPPAGIASDATKKTIQEGVDDFWNRHMPDETHPEK
jgi:hypothetical protein